MRKVNGANGIRIIVQSTKHPSYVEGRIENFLENFIVRKVNCNFYYWFLTENFIAYIESN